jgi:hypothetical protein
LIRRDTGTVQRTRGEIEEGEGRGGDGEDRKKESNEGNSTHLIVATTILQTVDIEKVF